MDNHKPPITCRRGGGLGRENPAFNMCRKCPVKAHLGIGIIRPSAICFPCEIQSSGEASLDVKGGHFGEDFIGRDSGCNVEASTVGHVGVVKESDSQGPWG